MRSGETRRLSEKSLVLFIQYPSDEGLFLLDCRPFSDLTYPTLKFLGSTWGKSTQPWYNFSAIRGQYHSVVLVVNLRRYHAEITNESH